MSRNLKLLVAYAALLLLSHIWQSLQSGGLQTGADGLEPLLQAEELVLAFGRAGPVHESDRLVVEHLAGEGGAYRWLDFRMSDEEAVAWVEALLRRGGGSLRIVGFGYGSIDATLLAESLGGRVNSLILVDPALSTRFELLGDERLNRALKAFQVAWFWLLEQGVPHFGLSRSLPYNLDTARQVYSADQAAAGEAYGELDLPIYVAGEQGDAAKLEAYRGANGRAVANGFSDTASLIEGLSQWLQTPGEGVASEQRRGFEAFPAARLGWIWGGLLLAVATFASEDLACIGGGLMAASGSIDLWVAILGCLIGIVLGDLGIFFMGRLFGSAAPSLPLIKRLVPTKSLDLSREWFEKRGVALVVLTRFFPGSRVPTYFAAGAVGVGWVSFAAALLLASAIWTPLLVLASFYLGEPFLAFFESIGFGGWIALVAVLASLAIVSRVIAKLATWKGRRLLYSRWRRLVAWEFWPMWAVYLPVVPYIFWLALRHRSLSLPFSVNPCMPASGLVYESKIEILRHLQEHGVPVARFEAIPCQLDIEEKLSQVRAFMARTELAFPIVLKPDVGQRGQGVAIVKDLESARRFFEQQAQEDSIVQEFVAGREYGVFYQRFISQTSGRVTSITDKRITFVTGNGRSSLERLILSDPRAVCMARFFLALYEDRLDHVPEAGERFVLASIGTHSRGALFLDGESARTPEMEAAVDAFSRKVEGFHFGRYDLRVPDEDHFKRGEAIKVIELNGITSEPTDMYDPKHGPIYGWSKLMRQWRSIFELAKENRLAGHEPVSKKFVLALALAHFRGSPSRSLSSRTLPPRRRS